MYETFSEPNFEQYQSYFEWTLMKGFYYHFVLMAVGCNHRIQVIRFVSRMKKIHEKLIFIILTKLQIIYSLKINSLVQPQRQHFVSKLRVILKIILMINSLSKFSENTTILLRTWQKLNLKLNWNCWKERDVYGKNV